jgi:hypothetical protein
MTVRFRLWRLGFGSLTNTHVYFAGTGLSFRRLWWRIWIADVFPVNRSHVRRYFTWRLGQLRAAIDLHFGGVRAACDAMRTLNQAAKNAGDPERSEIYKLKQRLIGELLEAGYQCRVTRHEQTLKCHGCHGTGEWVSWNGLHSDRCYRCGGSGVFASHILLLFSFDVEGRAYDWHQPAEFWTMFDDARQGLPYCDECAVTRAWIQPGVRYETLIETVARWIDGQGLRLGLTARNHYWRFWPAVRDDVAHQGARLRAWRADRRARARARAIHPFACNDDDLPF